MIKQLFYAVAVVVLLFFAVRLMGKVKDVPPEEESELEQHEDNDKEEEDADIIANE